eukprot:scaffold61328_cov26-Tisochrysis_lutea.AAC.1
MSRCRPCRTSRSLQRVRSLYSTAGEPLVHERQVHYVRCRLSQRLRTGHPTTLRTFAALHGWQAHAAARRCGSQPEPSDQRPSLQLVPSQAALRTGQSGPNCCRHHWRPPALR